MRKLIALFMLAGIMFVPVFANAQDASADSAAATEATPAVETSSPTVVDDEIVAEEQSFHQILKEKFIEGDPLYMTPVLLCLIFGLAIALERIITLNLAATNSKKLLTKIEDALSSGGVEAAKEITRSTKGPVASIFTQGLMRERFDLDLSFHLSCSNVGFHGYCNRYDFRLRYYRGSR